MMEMVEPLSKLVETFRFNRRLHLLKAELFQGTPSERWPMVQQIVERCVKSNVDLGTGSISRGYRVLNNGPLKIGLLWHSLRSDNLGVGALALANIQTAAAAARKGGRDVSFVVVGYGGPLHYRPEGVAVSEHVIRGGRELLPGGPLWRTLGSCDAVLDIGAGDSWADIYGVKRFVWQWWSKAMVLLQRSTLVLSPQTIGPFDNAIPRFLAGQTMRRAHGVFARDAESLEFVKAMGAGSNALETVDVAFRLPFTRGKPLHDTSRIQFGLNVSGLLYAGGYTQNSQFGSRDAYRATIEGIVTRLLARGDVDITIVPHVVPNDGSVEDDVAVSRAIASRFPAVKVSPIFPSPSAAKSFISSLDILAGSRMHATIAAASAGIAVVPLAYSRKFRGVFHSIGYPLVGDCTTMEPEQLIELTMAAVERRTELAAAAQAGTEIALSRIGAYEDYLADLFRVLPGK
jgi:colanic acid/amylovoran biosynthesis protein